MKSAVVGHTHGHIVASIRFFNDKNPDFLLQILPLFKTLRIY